MCNCYEKVNVGIADANMRVARGFSIIGNALIGRTMIATERLQKGGKKILPALLATFCPFCGVRELPKEGVDNA